MDDRTHILNNLQHVIGCNGLGNFKDFGQMRLDTLEWRVDQARNGLSATNIISIFVVWLQAKGMRMGLAALPIIDWCAYLARHQGCSRSQVLSVWDNSHTLTWHQFERHSEVPDLQRLMQNIRREIERKFTCDGATSVGVDSQRQARRRSGSSSQRRLDDPRGGHRGSVPRSACGLTMAKTETPDKPALRPRDHRDISTGRLACKTDCDTISAKSAGKLPGSGMNNRCGRCNRSGHLISHCPTNGGPSWDHAPPARYVCIICGAWGTHYVWDCPEQKTPPTAQTEALPVTDERKSEQKMQGAPPTQMNTGNIHLAVVPSKSDLLEPRRKLKEEPDDDDLLAPKLGHTVALPVRPSSPPKFPRAPRHDSADLKPNDDDLMEWSLSLKTEDIKSLRIEICAQETDRESPKVEDKRVGIHTKANMTPKELSTAEEVALQCADEFLCRLQHAVKRRYKDGAENDLMLWDDEIPSKKPKIEAAADDQDCVPGQEPVSNVDAFPLPCPAIATGTYSPGSEKFPSVQKLSQLFFDQMNNGPSAQFLFPSHAWEPAIQESRQSAMELWPAGLETKTEDTCDDGQVVDRGGRENVGEVGLARN